MPGYRFWVYLLLPLFFVALWFLGRKEPAWRKDWKQRLGYVPAHDGRPLWIHAASVGEVNSAAALYREIRQRAPHIPLYLTAFTPTGAQRLRELNPDATVAYLPLDTPGAVKRFLLRVRPRSLVILETEFWPNLLAACAIAGLPVYWLSARLSEKTPRRLKKVWGDKCLAQSFQAVQAVRCQTQADAARFAALGAPVERVHVSGSLKYDIRVPSDVQMSAVLLKELWQPRLAWLAASTHPGEEEQVIAAHQALLQKQPDALLLLAPRHPRRRAEIEGLLKQANLSYVVRSDGAQPGEAQVYLLDTLGELMNFYAACDFCFVGGSLVPVGGHNLLEPAALSKATITGPHVQSCQDIADGLLARQALCQVDDEQGLTDTVLMLAAEMSRRVTLGQAAHAVLQENRGSLENNLRPLTALLAPGCGA